MSAATAEPVPRIPPPRVFPAEYLGRARAWRQRFAPTDLIASQTFDAILLPLIERARRHPVPRPEMLVDAIRLYRRQMPEPGRMALDIEHKKTRLAITDLRVGVSNFRRAHWDNAEPGIALMKLELAIEPRSFHAGLAYLACISLHGLARRVQRSFSISDRAIFDDLRTLAAAHETYQRVGGEFLVPVPDGSWAGVVTDVTTTKGRQQRILNARTFLSDGESR